MPQKQVSQYDKILRENLEAVIPGLIQHMLGIQVVHSEELPDDIQYTRERKPDALKKIRDSSGNTFVLHLEFQVADEANMIYRMAEYYIMLMRQYKMPVRQYVIFLGAGTPKMPSSLSEEAMQFRYSLIPFTSIDYNLFVHSEKPEEIILGILADFGSDTQNTAITRILNGVNDHSESGFIFEIRIKQLRILSQLRNLGSQINKIMDSIEPFISEEKDLFFMSGRYKTLVEVVNRLLQLKKYSDEEIAEIAEVDQEFIDNVRAKMAKQ